MSKKNGVRRAQREDFRCLWRLGPPLTISNREVKPTCADGTALLRVGEYVDASFKPHSFIGVRLFLWAIFFILANHVKDHTMGIAR